MNQLHTRNATSVYHNRVLITVFYKGMVEILAAFFLRALLGKPASGRNVCVFLVPGVRPASGFARSSSAPRPHLSAGHTGKMRDFLSVGLCSRSHRGRTLPLGPDEHRLNTRGQRVTRGPGRLPAGSRDPRGCG